MICSYILYVVFYKHIAFTYQEGSRSCYDSVARMYYFISGNYLVYFIIGYIIPSG